MKELDDEERNGGSDDILEQMSRAECSTFISMVEFYVIQILSNFLAYSSRHFKCQLSFGIKHIQFGDISSYATENAHSSILLLIKRKSL